MPVAESAKRTVSAKKSRGSSTARLEAQLDAVWAISEVMADAVGFDGLMDRVVPLISKSLNAERSTLFLADPDTGGLWSRVAEGTKRSRIQLEKGQGLAGWVAEHREALRVDDAYTDERFNPEVDAEIGFKTASVVAVPVQNREELLAQNRKLVGIALLFFCSARSTSSTVIRQRLAMKRTGKPTTLSSRDNDLVAGGEIDH